MRDTTLANLDRQLYFLHINTHTQSNPGYVALSLKELNELHRSQQ
jgi:hypothetical protein